MAKSKIKSKNTVYYNFVTAVLIVAILIFYAWMPFTAFTKAKTAFYDIPRLRTVKTVQTNGTIEAVDKLYGRTGSIKTSVNYCYRVEGERYCARAGVSGSKGEVIPVVYDTGKPDYSLPVEALHKKTTYIVQSLGAAALTVVFTLLLVPPLKNRILKTIAK